MASASQYPLRFNSCRPAAFEDSLSGHGTHRFLGSLSSCRISKYKVDAVARAIHFSAFSQILTGVMKFFLEIAQDSNSEASDPMLWLDFVIIITLTVAFLTG